MVFIRPDDGSAVAEWKLVYQNLKFRFLRIIYSENMHLYIDNFRDVKTNNASSGKYLSIPTPLHSLTWVTPPIRGARTYHVLSMVLPGVPPPPPSRPHWHQIFPAIILAPKLVSITLPPPPEEALLCWHRERLSVCKCMFLLLDWIKYVLFSSCFSGSLNGWIFTALPKHPCHLLQRMYMMMKDGWKSRTRGFVTWLNFVLTPPDEYVEAKKTAKR